MSLMSAIRRVAGGNGRARLEDEKPEDAKDDDAAEEEDKETSAEGDEQEPDAEEEGDEPEAEDDEEEADAEDGDDEPDASKMSAAERRAFGRGRKAERKRIGRILGSASAEANQKLAAHLAFATSDPAPKAIAALKASGDAPSGRLSGRMNGRRPSATGRGGDDVRSGREAGASWGKALAKAKVKTRKG